MDGKNAGAIAGGAAGFGFGLFLFLDETFGWALVAHPVPRLTVR